MASSVGDALLNITVDRNQVARALLGAIGGNENTLQNEGRKLGNSLTGGVNQGLTSFQKLGAGVAGLGAVVAGVSVKMALDFESSLTSIRALTNSSDADIQQYRKSILSLSGDVAQSPKQLAEALYFVSSAGFAGKEAIDVLTVSAKAAAAGLTDTQVVADAVTSAMNAYGHENLTAAQATDVLVATVNEGKAEFGDIAGSIGQVANAAAAAGITFNELGASIAALTSVGLSADESATVLKSTIVALEAPSDKVKNLLGELGLSADDVRKSIRDKGLIKTVQDLGERLHGQVGPLLELIPNHRTLALVLGATGAQAQQYTDILGRLNKASDGVGATNKAFAERQKDVKFQLEQTWAAAQALLVSFGEKLIPVVRATVEAFRATVGWLDQNKVAAYALAVIVGGPLVAAMVAWTIAEARVIGGKLLSFWASVADVAAGLIGRLLNLNSALGSIGQTEGTVATSTRTMLGTLGLIGAAVGAFVIEEQRASDHAKELRRSLDNVADSKLVARFNQISTQTEQIARNAGKSGSGLGAAGTRLGEALGLVKGKTDQLRDSFKQLAEESPGTAQRVIDQLAKQGKATGDYQKILDGVAKTKVQEGVDAQKTSEIVGDAAKKMGVDAKAAGVEAASGISELTTEQEKAKEAAEALQEQFNRVGGSVAGGAELMVAKLNLSADETKKLADSVADIKNAYGSLAPTALQGLVALSAQGKLTADQLSDIAQAAKSVRDGMAQSFGQATSVVQAFADGFDPTKGGPASQILKFFKDQVAAAQWWAQNLQTLAKAGLDQGLLSELAQAGPKAAPLIAGLLDAVKAGNLGVINKAQDDLRSILTGAQNTVLGYTTPFMIAGATAGSGLNQGLGQGVAGAGAAMQSALQTALDAANLNAIMKARGLEAGGYFVLGMNGAILGYTKQQLQQFGGKLPGVPGSGLAGPLPPVRAGGGPVYPGQEYIVGEKGWEVFRPTMPGYIVPHDDAVSGRSGGAAGPSRQVIENHLTLSVDGHEMNVATAPSRPGADRYNRRKNQ